MAKQKAKKPASGKPAFRLSPAHVSQKTFLQKSRVYVMHNMPYFFLNKFGISNKPDERRASVSHTTPGYVFYFLAPELEFAWHLEQFIHWVYHFQNIQFKNGSGKREWYLVFSPVVGAIGLYLHFGLDLKISMMQHVLLFFCPMVWLDGWLWLFIFACARFLAYVAATMAIIYFFAHIQV